MIANLPEHMLHCTEEYIEQKLEPGGFLRAVLEHNLTEAYQRADHVNKAAMEEWVTWLTWDIPSTAHGSREKVEAWLAQ